jgi:D-alanine-D-alanine ligase
MTSVLHVVGSPTSEFFAELSRLYAADCLDALGGHARWEHHIAHVDPGGTWRFPASLAAADLAIAPAVDPAAARDRLVRLAPDVAVPQMFCRAGMTDYRALLEELDIPYVGNRPDVMAVGASKPRTKQVAAAAGIPVPAGRLVGRDDLDGFDADGYTLPAVVKPADADNSDGLTLVRDPAHLRPAVERALRHSSQALVEQYVELGREVRCGVLECRGALVVLPLEEYAVDPVRKPVRAAADKLTRRDGRLALVAKDREHAWIVPADDPATVAVGELARRAHRALGCRHYSLFDVRIDPAGRPWLLEAGLYCSYARASVLATMAAAAGIDLPDLFGLGVDEALRRKSQVSLRE